MPPPRRAARSYRSRIHFSITRDALAPLAFAMPSTNCHRSSPIRTPRATRVACGFSCTPDLSSTVVSYAFVHATHRRVTAPNMGHVCTQRKCLGMRTDVEDRISRRMEETGITGRALARATGERPSNVQRWLKDGGAPTAFLLACEEAGLASAAWLLTGHGAPDASEIQAQEILERIRELVAPITRSPEDESAHASRSRQRALAAEKAAQDEKRRRTAGG